MVIIMQFFFFLKKGAWLWPMERRRETTRFKAYLSIVNPNPKKNVNF